MNIIASPRIGGAERVFLTLSSRLDRDKFDLMLGIFIDQRVKTNPLWEEVSDLNIPLAPIRLRNAYDLGQFLDLYRIVRKYRPHIIHTHGYKTNILGFLTAKCFRVPLVSTFHGWSPSNRRSHLLISKISHFFLKRFDCIITVSDQIKSGLKKENFSPGKLRTLRNVSPYSVEEVFHKNNAFRKEIGIPDGSKLIGYVGRLEPIKGCDTFIEAISILTENHPEYRYVIIGEGSERERLQLKVKKLRLEKSIRFCGFRKDVLDVLKSLDLYILPSLNEGIPLTLLEAMQCGVPVIATRVGGVPEVIRDGFNGILIPPANPTLLAAAIVESLTREEQTKKRVVNAKITVAEEFSVAAWIKELQNIYGMVSRIS